ncbi:MAG: hypothetical protein KBS59_03125 [Clostridiales bacterium]|nr:hypothetical protein [Clostridiales bacterium]
MIATDTQKCNIITEVKSMSEEVKKAVSALIEAVGKLDEYQLELATAFMSGMAAGKKEEK